MTLRTISLFVSGALAAGLLSSCAGGGKPDPVAKAIETQTEQQKAAAAKAEAEKLAKEAEDAKKEDEARAIAAPINAGEFQVTVVPDASAMSAFALPVHVFSCSSDVVETWKSRVDEYWDSPAAQQRNRMTFGQGKANAPVTVAMPTQDGHDAVIVIAKLPASVSSKVKIVSYTLKREPNPADPTRPIRRPKSVRVGTSGVSPN